MNLDNYVFVFNDESTNLLVSKKGRFYDINTKKFREPKYLMGRGYLRISIKGEHNVMPTKDMVYKIRSQKTWKHI